MSIRLLFLLLIISHAGWAQEVNRYMVFFSGKEGSGYSLNKPQEFLSPRALERRRTQQISLTEQDLPVNEQYVQQLRDLGVAVYHRSRWLNAVLVETSPDMLSSIGSLSFVTATEYVAPGKKLSASAARKLQAPQEVSQLQHQMLDIPQMHSLGYTGKEKMIAVLDDGFLGVAQVAKFDHLFRNQQLQHSKDFVGNAADVFRYDDHGTKSLSTIAVVDSGNFIGTAPDALFLLAITEDVATEYIIEEYNWLMASEWADSLGADIITSSLGYSNAFDDPAMNHPKGALDGKTTVAARAAVWATQRGILVVNSAGNSRGGDWNLITTPADAPNILAVGAIDAFGQIAGFSSPGPAADGSIKPEVVALGVMTFVVGANGIYQQNNGTSFAAPQIAGLAAAVWQAFPALTNLEIRELIIRSGNRYQTPDYDYGYGLPSFERIFDPSSVQDQVVAESSRLYPNPVHSSNELLYVKADPERGRPIEAHIYSAAGKLITKKVVDVSTKGAYSLQLDQLPAGLYVLQLIHEKGVSKHKFLRL